ncbi:MAG: zinc/manganese transport system permease protein [Actinomycetota bacterium]|nr:zinc/manganese transport system permease protein [Actinomycetota bacterium]
MTAAEATQVVGALLLLARLIAAPAGAALRLTTRPYRAMWLSAALSVAAKWLGLTLSYAYPKLPPSLAVIAATSAVYLAGTLRAQAAARTVM